MCFFDDKKFQLAVAVGKPVEDWVPVFAHESSHMDQFIDDISWWDERSPSCDILDLWLGDKEYLDEELNKAFKNVMELELEFG